MTSGTGSKKEVKMLLPESSQIRRRAVTTPRYREAVGEVADELVKQASIIMETLKATKGDAESSSNGDASSVTMLRDFMCIVAQYERAAADALISLVSTDA
jgi:hypothetical protein